MEDVFTNGTIFTPEGMVREFETTFYEDFTIAEKIGGVKGIRGTYKRAFENWKESVKYFTELVVALNWKMWHHYDEKNTELSKVYEELWGEADLYAQEHFKGKDLDYFYRMTD